MGFFDEIIDADWLAASGPPSPDQPWIGPPHDVVPTPLGLELELVRTDDFLIWLSGAAVFPCGVSFELQVRWDGNRRVQLPVVPGERGRAGLCLGALSDDGQRTIAVPRRRQPADPGQARALVAAPLRARPHQATSEVWMWPLPAMSFTWVLEWQGQSVRETRAPFDVSKLSDAAHRARPVWRRATEKGTRCAGAQAIPL